MWVLQMVVASCLASSTLASPQLFPFTNLKKYFDHQTRNGPNSESGKDLLHQPTRSLPTVLPTLEKYQLESEVPRPVDIYAPLPVQIHRPPSPAPALIYAASVQGLPFRSPNYATVQAPKPPSPAPAFNYAPYLSGQALKHSSQLFKPASSEAPSTPEELFVDILKETPKASRLVSQTSSQNGGLDFPSLEPTALPFTSYVKPQVFGTELSPSTSSFLGDAYKPKPFTSTGDAYKPKSSSSTGDAYKPKSSSSTGDAYKSKPNSFSNNKYPKKYESELFGYNINGDGGTSDLYVKKKNYSPKREQSLLKEQKQKTSEHVAKTINAANFQKDPKLSEASSAFRKQPSQEQQTSETGFHGIASGAEGGFGGGFGGGGGDIGGGFGGGGHLGGGHLGGGERVEFQMHGHHGPHTYKFGYDTGKGHNRQFRFEERDAHGHVKGHYGFYDKSGKLQMVNYHADHHGFHADGNFGNHANR